MRVKTKFSIGETLDLTTTRSCLVTKQVLFNAAQSHYKLSENQSSLGNLIHILMSFEMAAIIWVIIANVKKHQQSHTN